ncbi:MAG TPA: hypothetical protein VI386_14520, partial [Candidatus Sulfotelmatobacter sp.]
MGIGWVVFTLSLLLPGFLRERGYLVIVRTLPGRSIHDGYRDSSTCARFARGGAQNDNLRGSKAQRARRVFFLAFSAELNVMGYAVIVRRPCQGARCMTGVGILRLALASLAAALRKTTA